MAKPKSTGKSTGFLGIPRVSKAGEGAILLLALLLAVGLGVGQGTTNFDPFIKNFFTKQATPGTTGAAQTVLQLTPTTSVNLFSFDTGLNLASRSQLQISYIVWQGSDDKATGTLSSSAATTFTGKTDDVYQWAAYDDNGSGSDYYISTGTFTARASESAELKVWKEATPSSDVTVTVLETDGTQNDGTIAMGSSGSKTIGLKMELNNVNVKYQDLGICFDYDTGNLTSTAAIGASVSKLSGVPTRLSGNEECYALGVSLPTDAGDVVIEPTVSFQAKAGKDPILNVTYTIFDRTQYIDPITGIPNGQNVVEDNTNTDVGAADKTGTVNIQ